MQTSDVVVIGAGLSGLAAATRLAETDLSVTVLEARDRVGGRTQTVDVAGARLDVGGQWLGPTQDRMYALAQDLGLGLFGTYTQGEKVLELDRRISTYRSTIPSLSVWKLLKLQRALNGVQKLQKGFRPGRALEHPKAEAWDRETLQTFKERLGRDKDVHALFDAAIRTIFGAEPSEMSMLYFLSYAAAGGGFLSLCEVEGGAQQDRFVEGAQSVSIALAERLPEPVVLEAPVRRVEHSPHGVVVHTDRGAYQASRAIFAMPPPMLARVRFEPPLPPRRAQLLQRIGMGAAIKVIAVYDRAFWRDAGFSGEAVADGRPLSVAYDNTSADGSVPNILGFIVGRPAREYGARPADERRQAVLTQLERWFGKEALAPVDYIEKDWSTEEFSGGCPVVNFPPGVMCDLGRDYGAPVGVMHWAGTETATEWCGYMEGAVRAGERAAEEVLANMPLARRSERSHPARPTR